MSAIRITLDSKRYAAKPSDREAAIITERMKRAGSVEVDEAAFCEAVRNGQTWCGGCFKTGATSDKGKPIWGEFESLQVVGLDFDNDAVVYYADGSPVKDAAGHKLKRQLMPHEAGYLDPLEALNRCECLELKPLLLYFSFSSHFPDKMKYRLVIDLGEPVTDEADASGIIESLMLAFPECDSSCSNLNRLFFGTHARGEVWEAWRAWGDEE